MPTPLLIFSLPRAGSTLLQRILAQHHDIATVSEPWLLLPLLTISQRHAHRSAYSQRTAADAITEFVDKLPDRKIGYERRLRDFILALYSDHCPNSERYFLDKTPRYYLIIDDIVKLFPEGRFIFLFRNPLQVIASLLDTWSSSRLCRLHRYLIDIRLGIPALAHGFRRHASRSLLVYYEDLVMQPQVQAQRIFDFLELPPDMSVLDDISNAQVPGKFGDQTGIRAYAEISGLSRDKWRNTLASPYRKALFGNLLRQIDADDLALHTDNRADILLELAALDAKWTAVPRDAVDHLTSLVRQWLLPQALVPAAWAPHKPPRLPLT